MKTTIYTFLALGCLLSATTVVTAAETPPASDFITFRYDARGFFPADVKPPTDFDGVTKKNLLWKQPLPNFGNSSPIAVPTADGGRVFVLIDQGYPLGAGDVPRLQCYQAQTGKLLWDKPIDPLDTIPADETAPAREARHKFWEHQQALSRLYAAFQRAETEEEMAKIREEAQQHCGVRGHDNTLKKYFTKKKGYRWGGGGHWTMGLTHPDCDLLVSRDWQGLIGDVSWHWTGIGMGACTPISDGKAVYVLTGLRTLTKFDLDGNVLWHRWEREAARTSFYECWLINALQIVEVENQGKRRRLLIYELLENLWGYDCDSGELVWKSPTSGTGGHVCGTPQLLRLKRADGGEELIIAARSGHFVRARDGKPLLDALYTVDYQGPISDGRDLIWFDQRGGDGGHFRPQKGSQFPNKCVGLLRFRLEGKELKYDKVIYDENVGRDGIRWPNDRGFVRDGVLIHENLMRVEAMTGKKLNDGLLATYNSAMLAGGYFFGIPQMQRLENAPKRAFGDKTPEDMRVVCNVVADGDPFKPVGTRTVEIIEHDPQDPAQRHKRESMVGTVSPGNWYNWHAAYCVPFAFQDKLYIRTFDYLYCFGEK